MDKHTPGPWFWSLGEKSKSVHLFSRKGRRVVMGFRRWGMDGASPEFRREIPGGSVMERAFLFAKAFLGQERYASTEADIDHPDARLITASPDLLDALESLVDVQNGPPLLGRHEADWQKAMDAARAAIKKARGE